MYRNSVGTIWVHQKWNRINDIWNRTKMMLFWNIITTNLHEKTNPKKSLNNGQKCRKPVFMRVSGICFIKWLWFGSICELSNGKFFMVFMVWNKILLTQENMDSILVTKITRRAYKWIRTYIQDVICTCIIDILCYKLCKVNALTYSR